MDTKLKADIAESAVTTELLKRGFRVLQPVGDRLAYDLAVDLDGELLRLQVKSAWFNAKTNCYVVDARRTETNRRRMLRQHYESKDFDFAIIYLADLGVFYVLPISAFSAYRGTITFIERDKRQRKPKSAKYRERWDLLSDGLLSRKRLKDSLSNSVEPLNSIQRQYRAKPLISKMSREGVETKRQRSLIKD